MAVVQMWEGLVGALILLEWSHNEPRPGMCVKSPGLELPSLGAGLLALLRPVSSKWRKARIRRAETLGVLQYW